MKGLAAALVLGVSLTTAGAQAEAPGQAREIMLKALPKDVRSSGVGGRVGFRANLDRRGQITNCQTTTSSGHAVLDRYTCKFLTEHASFVARDAVAGQPRRVITGYLDWPADKNGDTASAGLSTDAGATTLAASEPLICKSSLKTGSLVRQSRTCMTKREWDQQRAQAQQDYGAAQGSGFACDVQSGHC
jgi:hypothetical protein